MPLRNHQSSPPATQHRCRDLCALTALAVVVQVWCVTHAAVPALDCVRFAERAKAIEQLGPIAAITGDTEQPLFPLLIATVHRTWHLATPHGASWATTAQMTAAFCLVLCIVPLYGLSRRALGRQAAIVSTAVFCLLPEVARLGGDGTSDSLHLLLFTAALWASHHTLTATDRRASWCAAAGMLIALAVLTRAEALVLLPALGITVIVSQRAWQSGTNLRSSLLTIGCGALGLALVVVPVFYFVGVRTAGDTLDRTLGRPTHETAEATSDVLLTTKPLADTAPLDFAAREPGPSIRRRGIAAGLLALARELAETFHYLAGMLVLLGIITAVRRGEEWSPWLTLVVCLTTCYLAATGALAAREGYLSARHLVSLVPATIAWLLAGASVLAAWFTPKPSPQKTRRFAAGVVVVAALVCVPRTAAPLHTSRTAHRQASDWLADSARDVGTVLDTRGWTGLYTRRATYGYDQAATAFADPTLAYVVVERREVESTSDRAATLRRLLDLAAEPAATFAGNDTRPDRNVMIYRWHHNRLTTTLASRATIPHK